LPNNKVNRRYNGQCSEKEPFTTSGWQLWQIYNAIHWTMSSRERRQEQLGSRRGLTLRSIAQQTIEKEACSSEMAKNALFTHCIERAMALGLSG